MRLVIDSNVWISALVFGGKPRQLLEAVVREGHEVVISEAIVIEIRRIIRLKFPDFIDDFEALMVSFSGRLIKAEIGSDPVDVSRDPDDNLVLETAVAGKAVIIVSGDKDLLDVQQYQKIRIYKPSKILDDNML